MTKPIVNPPTSVRDPALRTWLTRLAESIPAVAANVSLDSVRVALNTVLLEQGSNPGTASYNPFTMTAAPTAPSSFAVSASPTQLFLTWDNMIEQSHVAYAEIWRNTIDDRDTAVLHGTATAEVYADQVGSNSETFYYWVRFVSYAGIYSEWNAVAGTSGQTPIDPARLLVELSGQITETALYTDLNTRIDLIDAPDTGLVDSYAAVSSRVTTTEGQLNDVDGEGTVLADWVSQTATVVGENQATVQTQATSINGLEAQYSVKIDVNGYVAGYGLSVNQSDYDDQIHSTMLFSVDTFAVASPGATAMSFVVDNGVVVMDAAFIRDATITDAKIFDLAVDKITGDTASFVTANIGDAAITDAMIGNIIQSQAYTPGVSGWQIDKTGACEFWNVFARGDIEASSITADALVVGGAALAGVQATQTLVSISGPAAPSTYLARSADTVGLSCDYTMPATLYPNTKVLVSMQLRQEINIHVHESAPDGGINMWAAIFRREDGGPAVYVGQEKLIGCWFRQNGNARDAYWNNLCFKPYTFFCEFEDSYGFLPGSTYTYEIHYRAENNMASGGTDVRWDVYTIYEQYMSARLING